MKNLLKKITSRKFILTVLTAILGIAIALKNQSNSKLQAVGYILSGAAVITYNIVEGKIDIASITKGTKELVLGAETLKEGTLIIPTVEEIKDEENL